MDRVYAAIFLKIKIKIMMEDDFETLYLIFIQFNLKQEIENRIRLQSLMDIPNGSRNKAF